MSLTSPSALALGATLAFAISPSIAQQSPQPQAEPTSNAATTPTSGGSYWGANYFPNTELTNQDGQKVRFFDDCIKDKVVLVSFIYTSCPDACPLETARIAEVQGILGDRVGKDVFFYSITIDPLKDTPAVLKEYAQRYQAGPGWQFLTGDLKQIEHLRLKLGLFDPEYDQKITDHGLNILIGNQKTGRWQKSGPFENPYVLAKQLGEWLHNWSLPRKNENDYAGAPKIRNVSDGEVVFRTRCASCHAIGGTNTQLARLGPNLFGVLDRREHNWLSRWLTEPDAMLAEKDPIAIQMFEAYNKVAMPNMRLDAQQVADVLQYLDEETRRVATTTMKVKGEDGTEHDAVPSCCAKKTHAVVGDDATTAKAEPAAAAAVAATTPTASTAPAAEAKSTAPEEQPAPRRSLSVLSMISIGTGLALAIATAFLGRREARSHAA